MEVEVPIGTEVWTRNGTPSRLADLSRPGERLVVAPGGRGGRGNVRFVSSTNRYPVLAEEGDPGEEIKLRLELKLIADVGIIGAPNAGKSSLLAAVSGARPKVAGYPFTTIEPVLGAVESGYDSYVMVDIPGLIEGAHAGAGLGHDFLRHVQRTKILVHVVDGSNEDSLTEYRKIRGELALYDDRLSEKREIVAFNKADLEGVQDHCERLREQLGPDGPTVHCISALGRTGLDTLLSDVVRVLAQESQEQESAEAAIDDLPVLHPPPVDRAPGVRKTQDGYVVELRAAVRIAAMVDATDWNARTQLMGQLRRLGVTSELEKAGARSSDKVRIGKLELEWE